MYGQHPGGWISMKKCIVVGVVGWIHGKGVLMGMYIWISYMFWGLFRQTLRGYLGRHYGHRMQGVNHETSSHTGVFRYGD